MVTLIYLESLVYGLLFAHGYVYLRWLCIVVCTVVLRIVTLALVLIVLPTIIVILLVRVIIF